MALVRAPTDCLNDSVIDGVWSVKTGYFSVMDGV